jgi:integrase
MRSKRSIPTPYHHKPTGQAAVILRDADGRRRTLYLGAFGSPEAERRYRQVLAEHLAGAPVTTSRPKRTAAASSWPTVEQLAAGYLLHADRYYLGPDGKPTREVVNIREALRMLLRLYGDTPTDRIGVREIAAVRQALVEERSERPQGRRAPNGLARRTINARISRVKAMFRWGVEQKLVAPTTWHELSSLRGLPKGRCGVHDHPPVEAVPWPLVEATLPHLVPTIRDAVVVQWWSGCRPAEVLAMTRRQLDTTGETWLCRLAKHKGEWRDKERVIALGPRAQEVLRGRLKLEQDAPLFSARDAWNEHRAAKRAARKTPATKQTRDRDRRAEAHAAAIDEFLNVNEYRRAIHRAADRAGVPRWSPHRLRHAAGTRIAAASGIEAARVALGHADDRTTRRYSHGADVALAADVAARHG